MSEKIWLSLAKMSGNEMRYVQDAFDSNWVVPLGPNVEGFEQDLTKYLKANSHVVALNSGTSAIHLALIQLGVRYGDEVICQSFTFAASANPIVYQGATPIFVDSEDNSWNMSPELLELAINDRKRKTGRYPKAIIPVHLYGMPARMDEIMKIACRYNIPVVEDAAEALGSEYNGQRCGTFGDFGVLSFNGNKIITTSGGGALVCSNRQSAEYTKFLATQARDKAVHYQHSKIGYNYRMSNICAGIGRGQMTALDEFVNRRREIHEIYFDRFSSLTGIEVHVNPSPMFNSNFWLTCITVEPDIAGTTNEAIRIAMEQNQIETRLLWKPLHLQPVFSECPFYGTGTSEMLFEKGLCLPSGANLSDEDVNRIADIVIDKHAKNARKPVYAYQYSLTNI